jgi:hypothetical protein
MWFRSVVGVALVMLTSQGPQVLRAQGPQAESGQFTLTQAGKQIATERYTRSAAAKDGELRTSAGLRVTYAAQITSGSVSHITLNVYAPTDSAKPRQTARVRFSADSMTLETIREGALVVEKQAAPRGAVPFVFPSVAWMEEIVKKGKTQGGASAKVAVAILSAPQQVLSATVAFSSPTQARLQLADLDITFTVDGQGRIVRGEVPAQNIVIERAR